MKGTSFFNILILWNMENPSSKILAYSPNWVGDAIMCIPALKAIRKVYSGCDLYMLAVPWVKEVYEFSGIPDYIITYDRRSLHRGLKGTYKLVEEIKQHRITTSFVFPNSWRAALIPWLAKIPTRAGLSRRFRQLFFLNRSAKPEKDFKLKHQVFYYLSVVKVLHPDIHKYEAEVTRTPLLSPGADTKEMGLVLAEKLRLKPEKPWLGLAPGAQYGDAKLWWPESFANVADRVAKEYDAQIVIFGSASESDIARRVMSRMKTRCVDLTGKTSLKDAMLLLHHCKVLLTNDSGLMHVGAALGIPLVAIFGSTDPIHTGPFGDPGKTVVLEAKIGCHPCFKRDCPLGHKQCMSEIRPDDVFESIKQLWEK